MSKGGSMTGTLTAIWRILIWGLAALLLVAIWLNYNDPEPASEQQPPVITEVEKAEEASDAAEDEATEAEDEGADADLEDTASDADAAAPTDTEEDEADADAAETDE